MKVKLTHVLIALLAIVIIFNLGKDVVEGMENQHKHKDAHHGKGVKREDIPEGDEDLYILKSQIVPPVCPKCPDAAVCPRAKPCAPCPPRGSGPLIP